MTTLQITQEEAAKTQLLAPATNLQLRRNIKHFAFAFMLCAALFAGYTFAMETRMPVRETAIAEQPIINKDAVNDYKNGEISRAIAVSRIEGQLNQLKDLEYIRDWEYVDASQEYVVTLKNNTLFSYKLQ